MTMRLTSRAFAHNTLVPKLYTCDGQDISPPLEWSGAPEGTRSFALTVDDPDAPRCAWTHWVVYNLPADCHGLAEGVRTLPEGGRDGVNSWGRLGYGGPCPPSGSHRYFHKLYALDCVLPNLGKPDQAALEQAMRGHVLAQAELVGSYQRLR